MEHEKQRDNFDAYFSQLPKELKELILLNLNLNIVDVLKIQSASKEWRELAWRCLTDLNTNSILLPYYSNDDAGRRAAVIKIILSRLNFNVLCKIVPADKDQQFFTEDMILGCRSLEYLELGFRPRVVNYVDGLKNLSEILFDDDFSFPSAIEADQFKYRRNINVKRHGLDNKETPINPKLNFSLLESPTGKWIQKEPIKFNRKFHRGGMIGNDLVVIGAIDGTLTFFKLDTTNVENATLVMHSSNNIHKGCINEVWNEQSRHTYVASSDGIVTAWDPSPEGPVLVQTLELPEEILFVCDSPSKHILAANSRKLFIADMETREIVKTEYFDDDITGLFGNAFCINVATKNRFYATPKYHTNVIHRITADFIEAQMPNFWISPDASVVSVVLPHEVQIIEAATGEILKRYSNPNSAKFDAKSGIFKFSPIHFAFSVSTGNNIVTYDLDNNDIFGSISPRISRTEIDAGNFPTCHVLWWDTRGEVLFGLFSNNTLCWWHLPSITKQRIDAAAQQEKQNQEGQQAKEKQEEQQSMAPGTPTDNEEW